MHENISTSNDFVFVMMTHKILKSLATSFYRLKSLKWNIQIALVHMEWMIGVLGHDSEL